MGIASVEVTSVEVTSVGVASMEVASVRVALFVWIWASEGSIFNLRVFIRIRS